VILSRRREGQGPPIVVTESSRHGSGNVDIARPISRVIPIDSSFHGAWIRLIESGVGHAPGRSLTPRSTPLFDNRAVFCAPATFREPRLQQLRRHKGRVGVDPACQSGPTPSQAQNRPTTWAGLPARKSAPNCDLCRAALGRAFGDCWLLAPYGHCSHFRLGVQRED
jgi:hypothetical protein